MIGEFSGKPTKLACEKLCDKRDESEWKGTEEDIPKPKPAEEPKKVEHKIELLDMPPMSKQLENLASTAKDVIKGVVKKGVLKTTAQEAKERLEICKACDKYSHKRNRCTQCGCFMKAKSKLKESKCPLGKWPT